MQDSLYTVTYTKLFVENNRLLSELEVIQCSRTNSNIFVLVCQFVGDLFDVFFCRKYRSFQNVTKFCLCLLVAFLRSLWIVQTHVSCKIVLIDLKYYLALETTIAIRAIPFDILSPRPPVEEFF